jgi:[2Fe-2S] binding domain
MSGVKLLEEGHADDDAEIAEWMSGNICRCAAYPNACTPGTGSSGKPLPDRSPPYDRSQRQSGQGCAFPGRCQPAADEAAGPGGQPAARHGPATQGSSKTTVTLDRLTTQEKDQRSFLTQRLHATDVAPRDG